MRFKVPLRGVHVGPLCIDGGPYEKEADAHAHWSGTEREYLGFICAKTISTLQILLVHELAHLASDTGHDDRWRKSVHRLGGIVPAEYRKRPRKKPQGPKE